MITGEVRSKIDQIWDTFWSGGISNSMSVIEQMTYLLFIRGLDEAQQRKEKQAQMLGTEIENPIFPATGEWENPDSGRRVSYQDLRWSRFKHLEPRALYERLAFDVFPFIKRGIAAEESPFAVHMRDAIFLIPPEKAGLLAKVVDLLDAIPLTDRDTKGDLYEYMLGKLASAGDNGQFRTPRHIIQLMVAMAEPTTEDIICDPACGTAGFLVSVAEYFNAPERLKFFGNERFRKRFLGQGNGESMFHGFDFDSTMLRIGTMNLLLHGVEQPDIVNRDSLSEDHAGEEEKYTLVLANPPFAGSLDYESCAKDLLQIVKTKKTELLFLALFLRLLKRGGRAAVIVPDGVLFGSSRAHRTLREKLVEEHQLEAVISMPSGVFKPYAGVSTAILFFTKTERGGTENVWYYDMRADGRSLDDRRNPLLPDEKLHLDAKLSDEEHEKFNLPDILRRWRNLDGEKARPRTAQSFFVPKKDIAANDYDLSINRYKEVLYEEVEYEDPKKILKRIRDLEQEIAEGTEKLEGMLG